MLRILDVTIGMPSIYGIRRLYAGTHGRGVIKTLVRTKDADNELVAHATVYPNLIQTQLYFKSGSSEFFNRTIQFLDFMGRMVLSKTSTTMPIIKFPTASHHQI